MDPFSCLDITNQLTNRLHITNLTVIFIDPRVLDGLQTVSKLEKLTCRANRPAVSLWVLHMGLLPNRPNRTTPNLTVVLLSARRHCSCTLSISERLRSIFSSTSNGLGLYNCIHHDHLL